MSKVLITGCAGFIGSHLLERLLLTTDHQIVGVDDFSNGTEKNIQFLVPIGRKWQLERYSLGSPHNNNSDIAFWCGNEIDVIYHLAAWGSVPRSIQAPYTVMKNNVMATFEVLEYARVNEIKRVVIASSSSVYGDNSQKLKLETNIGQPLSPYAASKQCCESLAQAYWHSYGIETICLRFFNVFGPRQNPNGAYAAVIPKWIKAIQENEPIEIYGDGLQSRDFTYVDNVVDALLLAGTTQNRYCYGQSINVACGKSHSLLKLADLLVEDPSKTQINILQERKGDIRNSRASIERAEQWLGYEPKVSFEDGIKKTVEYFKSKEGLVNGNESVIRKRN